MYHAYQSGYSVLPQLTKLGKSKIFQVTLYDLDRFLSEKQQAIQTQQCFVEHNMSDEIYQAVCDFVVKTYPWPLQEPHTFQNLALQIQEDLVIHRLSEETDWMAAGHICFPSGWRPEAKIGKTFEEIHAVIPGFNLKMSRKMAEMIVHFGPFVRFVWSVVFADQINFHPDQPDPDFDPNNPVVYIKIERQVTYGFPEHNAVLFVLRQHLIPEKDIDKPALIKGLRDMTPKQRVYKGVDKCFDELVAYLSASTNLLIL